ncbi:LAGLIDADG endonuclease (mitochondrion) [Cordyceps javanica]
MLKILLNAGKSPNLGFAYDFLLFILISIIDVKIAMTGGQSAGVRSLHTSVASQRLHAGDLIYAYLVGLIEGDGYFSIAKKGKYLTYELGIELSIRDVQLIYKIKSILGIGTVSFRERNGIKMVSLKIRNKKHLKEFILPIFDKYPMFSNKQYDYLRFKDALLSDIIYYEDLCLASFATKYNRNNDTLNSINSIVNASYFPAWLVGFIEAEGCFSTYKLKDNNYLVSSFDIAQKDADILISAIHKYLSFTVSIYLDKTNCSKLKVTGVRSIENVIKFLQNAPVKLLGHKKLQYLLWLKQLRKIPRYSDKIKIPSNY